MLARAVGGIGCDGLCIEVRRGVSLWGLWGLGIEMGMGSVSRNVR